MAQYKEPGFVHLSKDAAFDEIRRPGVPAPFGGIYRCIGCSKEIVALQGQTLPLEDDHQHKQGKKPIGWQLIVTTG